MKRVIEVAKPYFERHPQHKEDITALAHMCIGEIEDGESADHEIELMEDALKDLCGEA